jgi:predicted esterase
MTRRKSEMGTVLTMRCAVRCVMKSSAAAMLGLLLLAGGVAVAAECGPFGDAPAQVNHGWFAGFVAAHNPVCFGGKVLGPWTDAEGTARFACLYESTNASKDTPLPLIIFLHGSLATADSIKLTGLTGLVDSADLGGRKPGFILLALEGRYTTHYYPGVDANALGWDNWYRQLNPSGAATAAGKSYPENADAAAIDHFVQDQLASGKVDGHRIYIMGWSNGAAMALLYALNRPWLAAAVVYSAPDPFGAFNDSCPQVPVALTPSGVGQVQVFNPRVPLMHVRNSCDIEGICPNGTRFGTQMTAIGANLEDVILDSSDNRVTACDESCGTNASAGGDIGAGGKFRGFIHHAHWPSSWNGKMLEFLKQHPLGTNPAQPKFAP